MSALLLELNLSADVIFYQEHWLLTSQLYQLDDMLDDFHCISVSAMDDNCGKGVLRGRPYGAWLYLFVARCVIIWIALLNLIGSWQ